MLNPTDPARNNEAHLRRAHEIAGTPSLTVFLWQLENRELKLAANALSKHGDEQGDLGREFWLALWYVYDSLGLNDDATRCQFRMTESKQGFLEARLTLLPTSAGGRTDPILMGYRPNWNIGSVTESGAVALDSAHVSLEDATSIQPGGTGLVRLHPFVPALWKHLQPGTEIAMHEGGRVIGHAVILRCTWPS